MHDGHEALTRRQRHRRLVEVLGGRWRAYALQARMQAGRLLAGRLGVSSRFAVRTRLANAPPLWLRPTASDFRVFKQILCGDEYGWARRLPGVSTIVDCGANAGYVSAFLLNAFPRARLLAVEPDAGNAAVCRRNLAAFGGRAAVLRAAVWPKTCGLKIEPAGPGRECGPGEAADVEARGVPDLIAAAGFDRVGLLKLDVEGSERWLFEGDTAWLDRVDHLAVELHDDACRAAFARAVAAYDFEPLRSGELDVCLGLRRRAAGGAS